MHLNEINSRKRFSFSCIYLWTNTINGKHYVGQAHNFYDRMSQYKKGHFNKYMKQAINKYGAESFDITILECNVPFEDLDGKEQYWLDYYQSYLRDKGYNICEVAGTTFGYRHTTESKNKMSQIAKERFQDADIRKRMSESMMGRKHDEEWKKQHSDWLKERWATDEEYRQFWHDKMAGENNYFFGKHYCGEANPMYGKHLSEETKRKISEAKKGRASHVKKVMCVETNIIYDSIKDAADAVNGTQSGISGVVHGRKQTHRGYHWKLV